MLCWHTISAPRHDPWDLAVSPERFDEQLEVLVTDGEVVSVHELVAERRRRVRGEHRPTFAVTFDDGYVDNLTAALPVLERWNVPATVFIPTGYTDTPSFWWDRVAALTMDTVNTDDDVLAAAETAGVRPAGFDARPVDRKALHDAVYDLLAADRSAVDTVLDRFEAALPNRVPLDLRPMTSAELREFAAHPLITIGAHTTTHPDLMSVDDDGVDAELGANTTTLDTLLGPADRVLAYPHGRADRRVARRARQAGFEIALTTDEKWVSGLDSAMHVPRLHPQEMDRDTFRRYLAEVAG